MAVVRLMDLLAEREVIRNEALLLLVELSASSPEIAKIAAFEGVFDRWEDPALPGKVLNIVQEDLSNNGKSSALQV